MPAPAPLPDIPPSLAADPDFNDFHAAFEALFESGGDTAKRFIAVASAANQVAALPGMDPEAARALMRAAGSSSGSDFNAEFSELLISLMLPYARCSEALAPIAERLGLDPSAAELASRLMRERALAQLPKPLSEFARAHFEAAELTLNSAAAPSDPGPGPRPRRAAL